MAKSELERGLAELAGNADAPPPMASRLQEMVATSEAVPLRRPARQLAQVAVAALVVAMAGIAFVGLRPDLDGLSVSYRFLLAGAWSAAIVAVTALAVMPRRGGSVIRWRRAGTVAVLAGVFFVTIGLLWTDAAANSIRYSVTAANVLHFAPYCLMVGTATSLTPIVVACALLRRSVPVGAHWVGAGVGAASGCAGGLLLHWHCPIAEPTHFGLVHGGVVLIGLALGAIACGSLARAR